MDVMNKKTPEFSIEEYMSLLSRLDTKHSVFYKLWEMGKPVFTLTETSTAGVMFDSEGDCINFIINYDFWQNQSETQKLFVICHECLHIILNHGIRFFVDKPTDWLLRNQAADLAINHRLINEMGFIREEIDPDDVYCWIDKFFEDNNTPQNESVEWYYNRLKNNSDISDDNGSSLVDDHNLSDTHSEQDYSSVIEDLNESLSEEEKEFVKKILDTTENETLGNTAGSLGGNIWKFVDNKKVVNKKKKWETVIKNWAKKHMKSIDKEETQWARVNRRFVTLDDNMFLPTEMEIEDREATKDRIEVWFFQDTSGSCFGYSERFFDAARSLPEDKFDVKMHCFDTYVYETTLESGRLYGFGGTSFSCIENYITNYVNKNKCEYPKAVFVITDGWGDYVNPKKPEVWHWFLTPYSTNFCIPEESKTFNLVDFE